MPVLRPEDSTQGLLPANDVARTLLGDSVPTGTGAVSLRGIRKWPPYAQVARDAAKWFVVPKSSGSDRADRGTCVGCVTLLGGRVLSAHLFGSHTLFRDAWPDILATAMIEQRAAVRAGAPIPQLEQRAARGNPRGRALLVLRTLTAQPGRTREIPGGGLRWEAGGRADGVLAQGLVSASGRVVYVGLYPVPPSVAPPPKPSAPPAEAEEDPKKRRGGRFNPFGGTVPGGVRDPLTPPR